MLDGCYQRAIDILEENKEKLHLVANTLLEEETLSREEFVALMDVGFLSKDKNQKETKLIENDDNKTKKDEENSQGEEKLSFPKNSPLFD